MNKKHHLKAINKFHIDLNELKLGWIWMKLDLNELKLG